MVLVIEQHKGSGGSNRKEMTRLMEMEPSDIVGGVVLLMATVTPSSSPLVIAPHLFVSPRSLQVLDPATGLRLCSR